MSVLGVVSRWLLLRGLPLLRRIPLLRDLPLAHGYFWIRGVDLPAEDRRRLQDAVNRETVAFIGPNHPEFATDWLIDKELSTIVAPHMTSWADRTVVALAPRFWGMNNLVANDGGAEAKEYSVASALRGEGVLLHPEGTVRWTNDRVHPLFPGIAQMACAAAARTEKPVYIVPIVWKYRYVGDVSRRLHREMQIIERALALPTGCDASLATRFHALQTDILESRIRDLGIDASNAPIDFFERQAWLQRELVARLEQRYNTEPADSTDKHIARLIRAVRGRQPLDRADLAIAEEARRLGEFTRDVYGSPRLTQEQISESLKRIRDRLVRRGWRNALANMLPRPLGPRVVHVGVSEPLRVDRGEHAGAGEAMLLQLARSRMQASLDEINSRIANDVGRFAVPNPFVSTPPTDDRTTHRTPRPAP